MPILTGTSTVFVHLPKLWLAARDGVVLVPVARPAPAPETPMLVRFEGLSRDEQRRVLRSFLGGRRFVLEGDRP